MSMELQLQETREPTLADKEWLIDVLNGTNNGYLFAPTGWHCRIGRAFPDDFEVSPQIGPWPWRVERKAGAPCQSPFKSQPGACVAKLHGDGQVTIAPPFAVESMEEATLRIARKLEAHRWDLSVLSAAERAILSRP